MSQSIRYETILIEERVVDYGSLPIYSLFLFCHLDHEDIYIKVRNNRAKNLNTNEDEWFEAIESVKPIKLNGEAFMQDLTADK